MRENTNLVKWGIFLLLCIIWGSSFILMWWSTKGLSAHQIASLRIFSAGAVMLPFFFAFIRKIPRRQFFLVILIAVTGNLLPAYLFVAAIAKNVDSSLAGILNSLTPLFVVILGMLFFRSAISRKQLAGVIIGFAGLSLLTLSKKGISLENAEYAGWIVLGTILYGTTVNIVSHYLKEINPVHLAVVSLSFMTIPTALLLWYDHFLEMDFSEPDVQYALFSTILLGVVGSAIASVLFYILVQKAGALFSSLVTYGIPFVALAWGFIYQEDITFIQIACLCIILGGVYLARK